MYPRGGGLVGFKRIRLGGVSGARTAGSGAANLEKYLRWQSLLARHIRQTLLPASNSFPKQGASENLGSRMVAA
jgi:hypothetical protein